MIDIMALRQSYECRELFEIRWINGHDNPADAMTKSNPNKALEQFIETNTLRVRIEGWVQRDWCRIDGKTRSSWYCNGSDGCGGFSFCFTFVSAARSNPEKKNCQCCNISCHWILEQWQRKDSVAIRGRSGAATAAKPLLHAASHMQPLGLA